MDIGEVAKGLQEGKKYRRASIAQSYWIQWDAKKEVVITSIRGQQLKYKWRDDDIFGTDWAEVTDTKLAKVDVTKETILKAVCPSCSTSNTVDKATHESKAETVITCSRCGFVFGVNKEEEKVSDDIFKPK